VHTVWPSVILGYTQKPCPPHSVLALCSETCPCDHPYSKTTSIQTTSIQRPPLFKDHLSKTTWSCPKTYISNSIKRPLFLGPDMVAYWFHYIKLQPLAKLISGSGRCSYQLHAPPPLPLRDRGGGGVWVVVITGGVQL
jgi:hypothetical protein